MKVDRIAVIDDDPVYQFVAKRIIEIHQLADVVLPFYNGIEYLDYVKAGKSDAEIVLLDINMPLMDAWRLLDELQNTGHRPVIYLMSSSIDKEDQLKAKTSPLIRKAFPKPISEETIELIRADYQNRWIDVLQIYQPKGSCIRWVP